MKKLFFHASRLMLATMLLTAGFASCSDDDPTPPPPPPTPGEALAKPVLASKDISQNGFTVTWNAVANAAVYAYTIDAATAEEGEAEFTLKTEATFTGFEPGTEHIVRVKAVPASDATDYKESEWAEIKVTTLAKEPDFFTFRQDWMHSCGTGITCTPADTEMPYVFINATKDGIEYAGQEAYIKKFMEDNFFWIEQWVADGFMIFAGEAQYTENLALDPETDYMLLAVGVDQNGNVIQTGVFEYTTPAIGPIDCTFEITKGDVTYRNIHYTITPSDVHALWTSTCVLASEFAGMTDQQIIDAMMKDVNLMYKSGVHEEDQMLAEQDADYVILVVGCMQQQATTPLYKLEFRSGLQDFRFESDAYAEVTGLNYIQEGVGGFAIISATITANDTAASYRALCGPADDYKNLSDLELGKLIEKEWDEGLWHPEGIWVWNTDRRVPVGGEGIIAVLARDASGNSGRICRYTFTADPFGEPSVDPGPGPLRR